MGLSKSESGDEAADLLNNTGERYMAETGRARDDSLLESRMGDEPRHDVDILRLFEERTFEPLLLRLISQRMDPPPDLSSNESRPTTGGGDELPAYGSFTP